MWCEPTPSWKKPTGSLLILGTPFQRQQPQHTSENLTCRKTSNLESIVWWLKARMNLSSNKAVFFRLRSLKWHGD